MIVTRRGQNGAKGDENIRVAREVAVVVATAVAAEVREIFNHGLISKFSWVCIFPGNMPSWSEFSGGVTNNGYPAPSQDQYNNFVKHAARWGRVTSKQESAMALAQFLHESDGLRAKREYACAQSQCPNSYRQPGCDAPGQYYYGRGYIQLSWCEWNYRPASRDIFGDDTLVRDPDMVARDESTAWATAWWFWG